MADGGRFSGISKMLGEGVESRQLGKRIEVPAVLEDTTRVNGQTRGRVVHKFQPEVESLETPIVALWGGDESGHEPALEVPTDGLMLCPDYPADDILAESGVDESGGGGDDEQADQRRHLAFQDGWFLAGVKADDRRGLNSPLEADWYRHPSQTERRISEDGDWTVEHHAGHTIRVHGEIVEVRYERDDGETATLFTDGQKVAFDAPDTGTEFVDDPRVTVGVSDDGTARLGGHAQIGPETANRVDRTQESTDPDSPYRYAQQDERVAPIVDPDDDGETQWDNPEPAELTAPLDGQWYEARHMIPWERRAEDPDPTTTDPTDPTFVPLPEELRAAGSLPWYVPWVNTTEQVAKWWRDGASEVLFP